MQGKTTVYVTVTFADTDTSPLSSLLEVLGDAHGVLWGPEELGLELGECWRDCVLQRAVGVLLWEKWETGKGGQSGAEVS